MIALTELRDSSSTFIGSETVAILQCVFRDASLQGESGDQDDQNDPRPGKQEKAKTVVAELCSVKMKEVAIEDASRI